MRQAALYLRVSTTGQTTENQRLELQQVARRMGVDIIDIYCDNGISGSKGRDKRPAFDRLCKDAAKRRFDLIMAWSVDRLGRSVQDLVAFLAEIHALRIDLYLHQMGVFAEFERAMIQERVRAGLARARANGKVLGRPKISAGTRDAISKALASGQGIRKVAAMIGVGVGTVQRIKSNSIC